MAFMPCVFYLYALMKIEKKIADTKLVYIEIQINSEFKKLLVVPVGMGGSELNNIRFVSIDTPLGSLLAQKGVGDVFEFNSQNIKVLKIE